MRTIRFLNYFNLVVSIVLLWTHLKAPLGNDYMFVGGLGLVIWYNWKTLRRLMGHKLSFRLVNYSVGLVSVLFSILLIVGGLAQIGAGFYRESAFLFLGPVYFLLGLTTIAFTWSTLKYHRVA